MDNILLKVIELVVWDPAAQNVGRGNEAHRSYEVGGQGRGGGRTDDQKGRIRH